MKFTGDSSKKSNTLKRTIKGTIKGLKIKQQRITATITSTEPGGSILSFANRKLGAEPINKRKEIILFITLLFKFFLTTMPKIVIYTHSSKYFSMFLFSPLKFAPIRATFLPLARNGWA